MSYQFPEDTVLGKRIRHAVDDNITNVIATREEIKEYGQALRIGGAHVPNDQYVEQLGVRVHLDGKMLKWGEFKTITGK